MTDKYSIASDLGTKSNKSQKFRFIRLIIGTALILYLVFSVGLSSLLQTAKSLDIICGVLAFALIILLLILGSLNIWLLLRGLSEISYLKFFRAYAGGWTISLITPGQAGDLSVLLFLKKDGVEFNHAFSAYLVDKAITLFVFLWVSVSGFFFLGLEFPIPVIYVTILVFFGFICTFLLLKKSRFGTTIRSWIQSVVHSVAHNIQVYRVKPHLPALNGVLTFVKWLIVSVVYYYAFLAFGVHADWPEIAFIPIISTLIGYIPISIAGIGTVEFTAVMLFNKVGIEQSAVINAYLLIRAIQVFLAFILLLLFRSFSDHSHEKRR